MITLWIMVGWNLATGQFVVFTDAADKKAVFPTEQSCQIEAAKANPGTTKYYGCLPLTISPHKK